MANTLQALLLGLAAGFAVAGGMQPARAQQQLPITRCVQETLDRLKPDKPDLAMLGNISSYCEQRTYSEFNINDFTLRRDKFLQQDYDEMIMLWMVVGITGAGVFLAGMQLYASYKLAATGKTTLDKDSSVDLERNKISVRSSVTGLLILTVSFAFFVVFVWRVFQFKEDQVCYPTTGAPAMRDLGSGGLGPPPGPTKTP